MNITEKINLNTADKKTLQEIVGVGPTISHRIVVGRPFKDIYELSKVKGLGAKRMAAILNQDLIIV
jgi:competence protein ComEA